MKSKMKKGTSIVLAIALVLSMMAAFTFNASISAKKGKQPLQPPTKVKISASPVSYVNGTKYFVGCWNNVSKASCYEYSVTINGKTTNGKTPKLATSAFKVKKGQTMTVKVQSWNGKKRSGWSKTASKTNK